jgi:8-oxo-dGTP pyrophosphatase MutT (NUDIX family)
MSRIARLRQQLSSHRPVLDSHRASIEASVALILAARGDDYSLLMIRRATAVGDRWSGHIAFPGGRADASDSDTRATAERETDEEVGIELSDRDYLCRLDDLTGTSESVLVSGHVYWLESESQLSMSAEVAEAFWFPLREVENEGRQERRDFEYQDRKIALPALRVLEGEAPLLWGLSYRFLELLMNRLDREIPSMAWHANA